MRTPIKLLIFTVCCFNLWAGCLRVSNVFAAEYSYKNDEAVDKKYGFFDLVSRYINQLRVHSQAGQPAEVRSGDLPPFDQEKQRAQNVAPAPENNPVPCLNQKNC